LSEQFRIRQCEKHYLAVVEGGLSCSSTSSYPTTLTPTPLVFENDHDKKLITKNSEFSMFSSSSSNKGVVCSHWLNTTSSSSSSSGTTGDRVSIVDILPIQSTIIQPSHQTKKKYVSAVLRYVPLHTFTPIYNPNVQHTLVKIILETGRKHQIRAQMSHIGHPVVGDVKYGAMTSFSTRDIALHAYTLTIVHPVSQEVMTFVAPPPALWNKRFGDDRLSLIGLVR